MSETKKSHHYFGAALSHLINNGCKIAIIESSSTINTYSIFTDANEYELLMKYRALDRISTKRDSRSWNFSFTPDEVYKIWGKFVDKDDNKERFLLLVCSQKNLKNTEFVLINKQHIQDIFYQNEKVSITVRIEKHSPYIQIHLEKSQNGCLQIQRNIIHSLK